MTNAATRAWQRAHTEFFTKHPEREFRLSSASEVELRGLARAGQIVGSATGGCVPGMTILPRLGAGDRAMCIVRRAAPDEGRPLAGVFLLDGAPSAPPDSDDARVEEAFCAQLWGLAQVADTIGQPLVSLLCDADMLSVALAAITPHPRRHGPPPHP